MSLPQATNQSEAATFSVHEGMSLLDQAAYSILEEIEAENVPIVSPLWNVNNESANNTINYYYDEWLLLKTSNYQPYQLPGDFNSTVKGMMDFTQLVVELPATCDVAIYLENNDHKVEYVAMTSLDLVALRVPGLFEAMSLRGNLSRLSNLKATTFTCHSPTAVLKTLQIIHGCSDWYDQRVTPDVLMHIAIAAYKFRGLDWVATHIKPTCYPDEVLGLPPAVGKLINVIMMYFLGDTSSAHFHEVARDVAWKAERDMQAENFVPRSLEDFWPEFQHLNVFQKKSLHLNIMSHCNALYECVSAEMKNELYVAPYLRDLWTKNGGVFVTWAGELSTLESVREQVLMPIGDMQKWFSTVSVMADAMSQDSHTDTTILGLQIRATLATANAVALDALAEMESRSPTADAFPSSDNATSPSSSDATGPVPNVVMSSAPNDGTVPIHNEMTGTSFNNVTG